MRWTHALAVAAALVLASCTGAPPTSQTMITVACELDKIGPTVVRTGSAIAQIADPTLVDTLTQANQADALAHTAVQAACDLALSGSKPVAVMPTLAPLGVPPGEVAVPVQPTS